MFMDSLRFSLRVLQIINITFKRKYNYACVYEYRTLQLKNIAND